MDRTRTGIRPVDVALAVVVTAIGAAMMVSNIQDPKIHASAPAVVTFFAMTVPLVWRRRYPLAVAGVIVAALGAHNLLFGPMIRCGAIALVLFALGYTVASRLEIRPAAAGLAVVLAGCVLLSAADTEAGWTALPIFLAGSAVLWGAGRFIRHRDAMAGELRASNEELRARRDERAQLEVAVDRARLSGELDTLLHARLGELSTMAKAGTEVSDPKAVRAVLRRIERESRNTLDDMRQIVGALRGSDAPTSPAPSITHLDGLLVRATKADARVSVKGDPRTLPASVELSAYRIVEQLVTALTDEPSARIDVRVTFADDALEIRVAGPVAKGADVRAAAARARERALLHAGSLDIRVDKGQAEVVAQLPVLQTV